MKVAFNTLGCRTNQNDTAEMQTLLEKEGYTIVNSGDLADIYVINSCTVTSSSDADSRRAAKKSLAINEEAMVVFTGCYAQNNPEEVKNIPGLDILLGNADKLDIASAIRNRLNTINEEDEFGYPSLHMTDITKRWDFKTIPVTRFGGRSKAFIKVQTGCDEQCTFCTVARARGRSISDTRENILNNIRQSIDAGFKEITLTGINLGTYGMDTTPRETFSSLVEAASNMDGDFRIRISSINPMEIDDHLIQLIAERDNICPHLHIPLQSGDDSILSGMKRNYNSQQYREVIERAASAIPNLGLGADVIVGFPGETDERFENTFQLIESLPFNLLHVFSYSPRTGTDAFKLRNDIPKTVKKERNRRLTELAKDKATTFRQRFLNQTVHVLTETTRDPQTGRLRGHSEQFIPIQFEGEDTFMNQLTPVHIQDVSERQVSGCVL